MLPTGGAIEYDMTPGSGVVDGNNGYGQDFQIYRRVVERRTYADGSTTPVTRAIYSATNGNPVEVDHYDGVTLIAGEKHYFATNPIDGLIQQADGLGYPIQTYPQWNDGKENTTDAYNANGTSLTNLLRRIVTDLEPGATLGGFSINGRIAATTTTLADTNQVSKETFGYDQCNGCSTFFNNQTDISEYDYGAGVPGALLRHTHTDYVTAQNSADYACDPASTCSANASLSNVIHLRNLPQQTSVFDGNGLERARTRFEYDNYIPDQGYFHNALVARNGIIGLCDGTQNCPTGPNFTDPNYVTRGNPTKTTHYLLDPSGNGAVIGSVNNYTQYDVAGSAVMIIDPRSTSSNIIATTFDYRDNFGTPDDTVETSGNPSNTQPAELGGQASYAFPFAVINTLGHTTYSKYDYYLGKAVAVEDPNSSRAKVYYNDSLDRPTQTRQAVGTNNESQSTFGYDDTSRVITSSTDQTYLGDGVLVRSNLYDGLGRTTETRQYEGGTNYIATQTQYDALGRAFKTSNPFRQGESVAWTTTGFDALGRVISVMTTDNAVVSTSYAGNKVLVTDQAGKERMSQTNALGQLTDLWEITSADQWTEGVAFPGHGEVTNGYRSSYIYDPLGNLRKVVQGQQQRFFMYDSLSRLIRASNPELNVNSSLPALSDPVTGNNQWSIAYTYDDDGNLATKVDARNISTTYAYDALNRVISRTYQNDPSTTPAVTYTYDSSTNCTVNCKGRLVKVDSSVSTYTYNNYDAMGRVLGATETLGGQPYSMGYTYDLAGHLKGMSYPSGNAISYNYDAAGRLNDANGAAAFSGNLGGQQKTYASGISYNSRGQMSLEQFGTDTAIYHKQHFNIRGQQYDLRASTINDDIDWNRGAVVLYYTSTNWQGAATGPDNNGNVLRAQSWVPINGDIHNPTNSDDWYSYDSLNRLTSVTEFPNNGSNAVFKQTYNYDRWGNRTIDGGSDKTWPQSINNIQTFADPNTNKMYAPNDPNHYLIDYDASGNQKNDGYTSLGSTNGTVTRTYDGENRMITALDVPHNTTDIYSYDGDGRRVKRKIGSTETWQVYGVGGELLAEYAANTPASTPEKEYAYRNGQLLITVDAVVPTKLRPIGATASSSCSGCDASRASDGDLTTAWVAPGFAPQWIQLDLGQLSTVSKLRLLTAQTPSGHTTHQIYGGPTPDNLSLLGTLDGDTVNYQWLEFNTSAGNVRYLKVLTTSSPSWIAWYEIEVYGPASGSSSASGVHWLVTDQLGTPRMIFDQSGSLTVTDQNGNYLSGMTRHDYLPFGEDLGAGTGGRTTAQGYSASDGVRQHFTQKERDNETGLDFFEARYFSSTQGRFTSPDPLSQSGRQLVPQSWNRYAYVHNSPLRLVDPSGMEDQDPKKVGCTPEHPCNVVSSDEEAVAAIQTPRVPIAEPATVTVNAPATPIETVTATIATSISTRPMTPLLTMMSQYIPTPDTSPYTGAPGGQDPTHFTTYSGSYGFVSVGVTEDMYDRWYVSVGLGPGTPGLSVQNGTVYSGYDFPATDAEQVEAGLTGPSVNASIPFASGSLNTCSSPICTFGPTIPMGGYTKASGPGIPELGISRQHTFSVRSLRGFVRTVGENVIDLPSTIAERLSP